MATNNKINNSMAYANFRYLEKTLTASNINNMFATPVEVIPAPGSNKGIFLLRIFYNYKFNTTPASGGGNTLLVFSSNNTTNAHGTANIASSVLTASSSSIAKFITQSSNRAFSVIDNSAINITNQTAAFTGGDCSLKLRLYYAVVNLT